MPESPLGPRHFPLAGSVHTTAHVMHAIEAPEELYSPPGTVSTALKALISQRLEERGRELRQLGCMQRCERGAD